MRAQLGHDSGLSGGALHSFIATAERWRTQTRVHQLVGLGHPTVRPSVRPPAHSRTAHRTPIKNSDRTAARGRGAKRGLPRMGYPAAAGIGTKAAGRGPARGRADGNSAFFCVWRSPKLLPACGELPLTTNPHDSLKLSATVHTWHLSACR